MMWKFVYILSKQRKTRFNMTDFFNNFNPWKIAAKDIFILTIYFSFFSDSFQFDEFY